MPRKTASRTRETRDRFEGSSKGQKFSEVERRRREAFVDGRTTQNPLVALLGRIFSATGDPIFLEAWFAALAYGCGDPHKHPGKRLQTLSNLLENNGAIPGCIDIELERQSARGERPSIRAACQAVASTCGKGPTFEATVKRVERIYREHKKNGLPLGDTGRMLLIGKLLRPEDPNSRETKVCNIEWAPDNRLVRQAISSRRVILLTTDPCLGDIGQRLVEHGQRALACSKCESKGGTRSSIYRLNIEPDGGSKIGALRRSETCRTDAQRATRTKRTCQAS